MFASCPFPSFGKVHGCSDTLSPQVYIHISYRNTVSCNRFVILAGIHSNYTIRELIGYRISLGYEIWLISGTATAEVTGS